MKTRFGHWIGGEEVTTRSWLDNINPSDTRERIGEYAFGDATDVNDAVAAARAAFPAWSKSAPQLRHDILRRASDEVFARKTELGHLLASEEGKTLPEAIGEVGRAAQVLAFTAAEALRLDGRKFAGLAGDSEIDVTREPLGVVGIVTPWNFPIAIPAWKIAPALAAGNTVVFKPSELVPGSAWMLVDILQRAGLPKGVLNLVIGAGAAGGALAGHADVAALSFTGSLDTGRKVGMAGIASTPMKKLQLELGGKNPLVVLDDADLELAVECALNGAFYSTGQRCTASSRLIVTDGIRERFVARLIERLERLKIGHALADGTDIGPVVSAAQWQKDLDYIDIGKREGARLRFGGAALERATPGHYLQPALFTDVTPGMRIAREEIFGPVAVVQAARDYDEALALSNDTEFGLTAGICTNNLKHANHFRRNAHAGVVKVNLGTSGLDYHVPFGGLSNSSYGPREQGHDALDFYTTTKTAYTRCEL
ncbi:aldehyde dehydrogenase [Caballeronia hypogeia]|uniref:Aldehyde dehydrogenase n=1 Tax=Caballeronia hypogeia TaxID=1777140 RepID=A0A158AE85_9BURK|nr:aldehyde dehydrogenase family protein [Caballeronia hypogeia]SAK56035.1 aldehyde dehydrogenase [Caballeronia hypogeia]